MKLDKEIKICIIVGTRPGIIKMSPLMRECAIQGVPYFVIHTGQHYSPEMDWVFFRDLELKEPECSVKETCNYVTHGEKTAIMMMGIEKVLIQEQPSAVLVCGDANTNLAGALAARKLCISVGHVEAGLRSNDWRMPEEHNRVMMDHISELLFAPTEETAKNLRNDNVHGLITVTGNTIVDAVMQHVPIAEKKSNILDRLSLKTKQFIVMTTHREENVDDRDILNDLIESVDAVSASIGMDIIFPLHPRSRKRLNEFDLTAKLFGLERVKVIEPVGYLDMLMLLKHCAIVMTDSGGLQEEACVLKVPCVTLRENTERPETVAVGANKIAGTKPNNVMRAVDEMMQVDCDWDNPLGDGEAAKRIIRETVRFINEGHPFFGVQKR